MHYEGECPFCNIDREQGGDTSCEECEKYFFANEDEECVYDEESGVYLCSQECYEKFIENQEEE